MNRILLSAITFLFCLFTATSQVLVQVRMDSGMATTICDDGLLGGDPDPIFAAGVNGGTFSYYPAIGECFNTLPDTIFSENYACPADVPIDLEVCMRVSENDGVVIPPFFCGITENCVEVLCQDFVIPPVGQTASYQLMIDSPTSTSGEINFTVTTEGFGVATNDLICDALDLGTLVRGDTIGDMTIGQYSNICATDIGDPDPQALGAYFNNQAGVWFRFNTGPNPSGLLVVEALSDPENTGDPINLEMELFLSNDGSCSGNLQRLDDFQLDNNGFDHELRIPCVLPNTNYYIWVDGAPENGDPRGVFGLQLWDLGVTEGGDGRCDFMDLGIVPVDGSVSTPEPIANFCAGDLGDPFLPTFVSQHSVWFSFTAPPSGHVLIEAVSDTVRAPIGLQLAVYRTFNGSCTSFYSFVDGQFTGEDLDETMELTCLFPGDPYYILVDGSGSAARGAFTMTVSDAGDITPITNQDTTLCFGESLDVGNSTYTTSGMYSDTIVVFRGCDSIVNTNLTVLEELVLTVEQTQVAIGENGQDGIGMASATGGAGNYTYSWCTGETGAMATQLPAGQNCCVTVTDERDCTTEVCFEVAFATAILPTYANDTLACFGDSNGQLEIIVESGLAPYDYTWTNGQGTLSGDGQIQEEGDTLQISDLPTGAYEIMLRDAFFDTTFTVLVVEPAELIIDIDAVNNTSCFGVCDGDISTTISGGTPPYTHVWSTAGLGDSPNVNGLCAGSYTLEVTDANSCRATMRMNVEEPTEFIATAAEAKPVSCFEGSDGVANVTTNGTPIAWMWSSGATSAQATDLMATSYTVTVTNTDGCLDTTDVNISQPVGPLTAFIQEVTPISCFGAADGALQAFGTGPFEQLSWDWSNGQETEQVSSLDIGDYEVTVTNENGCEATAAFTVAQPDELTAETFPTDINCIDGPNAGSISIESVTGGTAPYNFVLDDEFTTNAPIFDGLTEGRYEVTVIDAMDCAISIPTIIMPPPPINVILSGEPEIDLGDSVVLTATPTSQTVLLNWSVPGVGSQRDIGIRPQFSDTYSVTVIDTVTLCQATDELTVVVDRTPRVYVPNIFSPNDDGANDEFYIQGGTDIVNIRSLRIFGRQGQLIYEQENLLPNSSADAWDGYFRGKPLNPDVFVYVAELEFFDGRLEIVRGDVTLVR